MPPTSTPPPGSEPTVRQDCPPELVATALERAVVVARRDARTRGAPPPPSALRPVLGFTKKLPTRALRTVQSALDGDESFRTRVAEGAEEAELGRSSWLYLVRPDGWEAELGALAAAAAEEQRDTDELRIELTAQRRVEQLADTVERLRGELTAAQRAQEQAEQSLATERSLRLGVEATRDELVDRVAALEEERARAVKQLKAAEASATARLEELRSVRAEVEPLRAQVQELATAARAADPVDLEPSGERGTDAPPADAAAGIAGSPASPWDGADPATVAAAVARAAQAAAVLGEALAAAAAELTPAPVPAPAERSSAPVAGTDPAPPTTRPPRRVPVRLRGGVHDGSAEGLQQLLDVAGMVAIVDGYNVTMEGWPALDRQDQRASLVAGLGGVQARVPAAIHVVFDGDADGRRPSVAAPLPVRVHFSPADTEADDVILSMVAGLPTDTPVLVVSSDRRVADGARRLGANSVRSSVLLDLLRR
jgi:predicted RNA-binding protein with PIN domain